MQLMVLNRPFPSSKKSHFQSEAKCEAIDTKMIFNYYANISHFHDKGFALSLVLKVRFFGTRKWPIPLSDVVQFDFKICAGRRRCRHVFLPMIWLILESLSQGSCDKSSQI